MKPFGKLTPEEQGALLLAFHNGQTIQKYEGPFQRWHETSNPRWFEGQPYRIKPKTKMQAEYWVGFYDNGNPLFVTTDPNYQPSTGYYKVHHPAVEIKE